MTIQRKMVVGLDDVQSITFECAKCHRLTVPPDDVRDIPLHCIRCGQEWLSGDPRNYQTIADPAVNFTKALQTIRSFIHNNKMGFRILLEFAVPRQDD